MKERKKRAAFDLMCRHLATCHLDEGCGKVNLFDKRIALLAAGCVCRGRGVGDDQGHLGGNIVKQILFTKPVIAEIISMVRGQHNHRVLVSSGGFEKVQQHAQLVIALLDQAHIGDDGLCSGLVIPKCFGDLVGEKGFVDRVCVCAFRLVADQCLHIVRPIHVVIGGWHNVGPVGLDEADMGTPRCGRLFDEAYGLARQPWRLAILFPDVGGLVCILDEPSRCQFAILDRPVGIDGPRIVGVISLVLEIAVIGTIIVAIISAIGVAMQSVITHPWVKPAF